MKHASTLFYYNQSATEGLIRQIGGSLMPNFHAKFIGLFNPALNTLNSSFYKKSLVELESVFRRLFSQEKALPFTALKSAFHEATPGEEYLISIEDYFDLANPVAAINQRQFLFHIPSGASQDYVESDHYYLRISRPWSVTMAAISDWCIGKNNLSKVVNHHERFRYYGFRNIPLRILACFIKIHQSAQLFPFAIYL
jgi:hypothetical protein